MRDMRKKIDRRVVLTERKKEVNMKRFETSLQERNSFVHDLIEQYYENRSKSMFQ